MPGRTSSEAFQAFVGPLAQAVSCVARTKFQTSQGGRLVQAEDGPDHKLFLGDDGQYVPLRGAARLGLRAGMRYRIIRDDRPTYGPLRVTTRGYLYSLRDASERAVIDYHWHPSGNSDEIRPHLHLGATQLTDEAVLTNKLHVPTGRITFEDVIRAAIHLGAETLREDWEDCLALAETPHKLYRAWH